MTVYSIILFLIITLPALPFGRQQSVDLQANGGDNWQVAQLFISEEGGFSIDLPGSPPRQTGKSNSVNYYEYTWPTNIGLYTVRYLDADHPIGNNLSNNTTLWKLRESVLAKSGGKAERDQEIMLGDYPGRELVINDERGIYLQRFYLVGRRVYDVSALLPDRIRSMRDRAEAVLNSFKLINAPAVVLGEADQLIKSLKEKNELILGTCAGDELQCLPLKAGMAEGTHEAKSGAVVAGKVIDKPQPEYPSIARAARAAGVVQVLVVVDEKGKVMAAQATMGHPLLRDVAVKAARAAKFTPTLLDGKPVKVTGLISYAFILQ